MLSQSTAPQQRNTNDAEKLSRIIEKLSIGIDSDLNFLQAGTHRVPLDNIPWSDIRHLHILGKRNSGCNFILAMANFLKGAYLDTTGSWLLLVHPNELFLQAILDQFTESVNTLSIYNTSVSSLDLSSLVALKELVLWQNDSLAKVVYPYDLSKLTRLHFYECDSLTDLPKFSKVSQLTDFRLIDCEKITTLPRLDKLTKLTFLILSGSKRLTTLPPLAKLKHMTNLTLSGCISLTSIPDLDQLESLTDLDCEGSAIVVPEDQVFPPKLVRLDLSYTPNSSIAHQIRRLQNLRWLGLNGLALEDMPEWLPEIAEKFSTEQYNHSAGNSKANISLYNTTVKSIEDMSIFELPYDMVVEWFEKRKQGLTQPLNEIKVVFLGDGEAGKSHTIARLMNDGGDPDHAIFDGQSTPGIVIRNKEYDLDGRKIQVHYWDFGGQEIMHSMHRIFLTGRTMYVILLNARDDTQGDRARYWLHNVKSFAPNAPVLLALNKIDQNENASVDEVELRGRYGKLTKIARLSALKYSQEEFTEKFTKVLLEEIKNTGYLDAQWPASWTKVKEQLENMDSHYILGDAYQTICEACQVDDNQKNLLHWFNDLGVSFCCCDEGDYALEDYVILRPDWITNALYIILFNKLEDAQNGLIPHASIHRLLKSAHNNPNIRCTLPQARYSSGDVQYVLGVMRKFNLSFPYGTDHEFIPMLCQQNSTVDVQYYHKDADILEFNMEFDYLPNNLLHRLMVERHAELDIANVWRTGARFHLPELGLSAVVVIDGNILRFFIRHANDMHRPNTYLAMLKANVDRIVKKMGLKAPECKLVYKVHGKQAIFSYDRLLKMHARGRKEEYCEDLDEDFRIEDILNQSAPAASEDLSTLVEGIISASLHLQGNKNYRGWDENGRNSVVRDSLADKGYIVLDQSLRGTSESGKSYGELDLLIQRVPNRPWVLCEALIAEGYTHKWNEHMDKLLNEYNPHGLSALFLMTYVDCEKEKFDGIWGKYRKHIREDDPKNFTRMPDTVVMDVHSEYEHLKIARCKYRSGNYTPTIYHIFVQMDPKPKAK